MQLVISLSELKPNATKAGQHFFFAKIDLDGDRIVGNVVGAYGTRFDSRDGVHFVIGRYENRGKNRGSQLVNMRQVPRRRPTGFKSAATR